MAKYKAAPFYGVSVGGKKVTFDYFGEYVTESVAEIKVLDKLAPKWIMKIEEPEKAEAPKETKEPEVTEKKPSRKTSGK